MLMFVLYFRPYVGNRVGFLCVFGDTRVIYLGISSVLRFGAWFPCVLYFCCVVILTP